MQIFYSEQDRAEEVRLLEQFDPAKRLADVKLREKMSPEDWAVVVESVRETLRGQILAGRIVRTIYEGASFGTLPISIPEDGSHKGHFNDLYDAIRDLIRSGDDEGNEKLFLEISGRFHYKEWEELEDARYELRMEAEAAAAGHGLLGFNRGGGGA